MEILLVDDVAGLGDIGEMLTVRPGYARNYLIPKGFAIEARTKNAKALSHKMRQIEAKKKRLKSEAEKKAEDWKKITVTRSLRVGSSGKVFGSVNAKDISEALKIQLNLDVDRRKILLSEPLRKLGKFNVQIKLHADVVTHFNVEITAEAATEDEEKRAAEEARIQIEISSRKKKQKIEEQTDSLTESENE